MDLIGTLARPALSWIFVQGGIDAFRNPGSRAVIAGPLLDQVRDAAPDAVRDLLPDDATMVQINAGVQVVAGVALATGTLPRIAALLLAGSTVPTTIGGHPFWKIDDPVKRGPQRIQFMKNVAIIGGLLLAATRRPAARRASRPIDG